MYYRLLNICVPLSNIISFVPKESLLVRVQYPLDRALSCADLLCVLFYVELSFLTKVLCLYNLR